MEIFENSKVKEFLIEENLRKKSMKLFFILLLLLANCKKENWKLMICSESHWSGGCNEILYELEDYKLQRDCMEKGIQLNKGDGFECGLNCRIDNSFNVCERICNENGCRD